jgi:hypothetical protein
VRGGALSLSPSRQERRRCLGLSHRGSPRALADVSETAKLHLTRSWIGESQYGDPEAVIAGESPIADCAPRESLSKLIR